MYVVPLFLAAALSGALSLYALRHRMAVGSLGFATMTLAVTIWVVGYALEIAGTDLATKIVYAKIEYLAIVIVPVAWLVFALQFSQRPFEHFDPAHQECYVACGKLFNSCIGPGRFLRPSPMVQQVACALQLTARKLDWFVPCETGLAEANTDALDKGGALLFAQRVALRERFEGSQHDPLSDVVTTSRSRIVI